MKKPFRLFVPFLIILTLILIYCFKKTDKNTNFIPQSELYESVLTDYFPIKEGTYWQYEGTKKEQQENGEIKTKEISKKITVTKIENIENKTYVYLEGSEVPFITVQNNTIDFEPDNLGSDKFSLTFPLNVGTRWGSDIDKRDDGYYGWEIEEKISLNILGKNYEDCYRIAYKTLPDTSYKVFCYGLGIVEEGYTHNGTIMEYTYKIVSTNIDD